MSMPEKNFMFNELTESTKVTLEGNANQYWVAEINGERGVVCMDGQHQREQQKRLDELVEHTKMREKGYTILVSPVNARFRPLYVKDAEQAAEVMRSYRRVKFTTKSIV